MITLSVKSNQPRIKVNPDHRYGIAEKRYGFIYAALTQEPSIERPYSSAVALWAGRTTAVI